MELIDKFLEYLSLEKNYSSHTVVAYKKDLKDFFSFIQESYQEEYPEDVKQLHIRAWIIYLNSLGVVNRSVNRKITSLKSFYKYLQKVEVVVENPLVHQKSLKTAKKVIIPFSEKEIGNTLLIENEEFTPFEKLRNKLMIHFLYGTGVRQSELIGLKLPDIDFEYSTIKVTGKRNKERIIPLYKEIIEEIKKYLEARSDIETSVLNVFITKRGGKVYGALVYRIINAYFSEVTTKEKKSPHVLRHSYATDLINKGADLNSVKELLGHSSLAATQVYTHNSLEKLKQVYNQAHPRSAKKNKNI